MREPSAKCLGAGSVPSERSELPGLPMTKAAEVRSRSQDRGRRFSPAELAAFGRRRRPLSAAAGRPLEPLGREGASECGGKAGGAGNAANASFGQPTSEASTRVPTRASSAASLSFCTAASTAVSTVATPTAASSVLVSPRGHQEAVSLTASAMPSPRRSLPQAEPDFDQCQLRAVLDCLLPVGGTCVGGTSPDPAEAEGRWQAPAAAEAPPTSRRGRRRSGSRRRCRSLWRPRGRPPSAPAPPPCAAPEPHAARAEEEGEEAPTEEAALWGLRCKLLSAGIDPARREEAVRKASCLLQRIQRSSVERAIHQVRRLRSARRRRVLQQVGAAVEARGASKEPGSLLLDQVEWEKFCGELGVSSPECEWLFRTLASEKGKVVDMHGVLGRIRAVCAPDVSLERFAVRLLGWFGSFEEAFAAHASLPGPFLRWRDFQGLAEALDASDRSAAQLWQALAGEGCRELAKRRPGARALMEAEPGIAEATFLQRIRLWAPCSALSTLRHRLLDRFASLSPALRTLERSPGLGRGSALAPQALAAGLAALGVEGCDATRLLREVPSARGHVVTLDDLFAALRDSQRGTSRDRHGARAAVREGTLGLWRTLHAVQDELRESHCWATPAPSRAERLRPAPLALADACDEEQEVELSVAGGCGGWRSASCSELRQGNSRE